LRCSRRIFALTGSSLPRALSDKTRLVILNTPHNPSATVWQREDFAALWQAIAEREIYVLSDEVYEHICFAAEGHASVLAHPQLRERAVAVSSFGKTFHMTGWKVGYCVAPAAISAELRKVHQYLTFAVNTPAQLAIADMLRERRSTIASCRRFTASGAICLLMRCAQPAGNFALRRDLLPAGGLQRDFRSGRCQLLPLADDRSRRRGDPAVGVLRRSVPAQADPPVLCQTAGDAAGCGGTSVPAVVI
jgi:aspartate/methionine/tyrosine aminotransferase